MGRICYGALPSRGSWPAALPRTRLQAGHRRAPVDWLPGLQALPRGAVGPTGQQLHRAALMQDTGGAASPPGRPCHRASWTRCPTCAAIPAWGGPCGCQGHSFPGGQDTAALRVAGGECEPQHLSHVTPTQTDADRGRCAVTCAHHTPTRIPSPSYKPHRAQSPPPGVWAKPTLREAKMVSDNEGRK